MKNTKTKFKINKKQKQTKQIGNKKQKKQNKQVTKKKKKKNKEPKQNKTKTKHLITVKHTFKVFKHIFFFISPIFVLFSNKHKINNIKSNLQRHTWNISTVCMTCFTHLFVNGLYTNTV